MFFEAPHPPLWGPFLVKKVKKSRPQKSNEMSRCSFMLFDRFLAFCWPRFCYFWPFFPRRSKKGRHAFCISIYHTDWGSGLPKTTEIRAKIAPKSLSETDRSRNEKKTPFLTISGPPKPLKNTKNPSKKAFKKILLKKAMQITALQRKSSLLGP